MKKKVLVVLSFFIVLIFGFSVVYADVIMPGVTYHTYEGLEKFEAFCNHWQSPFREICIILIILFYLLGMSLLALKFINKENEKNKSLTLLQKIFFGMSVILSLLEIFMLYVIDSFAPMYYHKLFLKIWETYAIYVLVMLFFGGISWKTKKNKIVYIISILLTIALLVLDIFLYSITTAMYSTYDPDRAREEMHFQELLKNSI